MNEEYTFRTKLSFKKNTFQNLTSDQRPIKCLEYNKNILNNNNNN